MPSLRESTVRSLVPSLVFTAALSLAGSLSAGTLAPPGPQIEVPDEPLCSISEPQAALFEDREIWIWRQGDATFPGEIGGAVFAPGGETPVDTSLLLGTDPTGEVRLAQNGDVAWVAWPTGTGLMLRELPAQGEAGSGLTVSIGRDALIEAVDLAVTPNGRIFVSWLERRGDEESSLSIFAQLLRADGSEATEPVQVDVAEAEAAFAFRGLATTAPAEDRFLVTWVNHNDAEGTRILARPVREIATPGGLNPIILMPEDLIQVIEPDQVGGFFGPSVRSAPEAVATAMGGFVVTWSGNIEGDPPFPQTFLRRFGADAQPLGPTQAVPANDFLPVNRQRPGLAVDGQGRMVVTWEAFIRNFGGPPDSVFRPVAAILLDSLGEPLGEAFQVNDTSDLVHRNPSPAFDADGDLLITWDEGPEASPLSAAPPCTGVGNVAHGRRFDTDCADDAVCLLDDRFEVTVAWDDPFNGGSGVGTGVQLTGDTGAFWFFDEENLELMVKVLDGTTINGHYWVFFGSLTNVEFTLTVVDRATDRTKTYHNPPFTFASEGDTTAFPAAIP